MAPLNVINDVFIWVSNISRENNDYLIDLSIWSEYPLKGVEFKLEQEPIHWTNSFPVFHSTKFSEINSAMLFEDISLYEPAILDLVSLESSNLLRLNYANDMIVNLTIDSLISFVSLYQNSMISDQHSFLILPIDIITSLIDINGAKINIENEIAIFEDALIDYNDTSINIPMGPILQAYVNGQYPDSGNFEFKLSLDGNHYNFSDIYIIKDECYIEILHTN